MNNTNYIHVRDQKFLNISMDPHKPIKILCHGLAASSSIDWYKSIAKSYIAMDYNIFAIDWAPYAFMGYMKAISVVQDIGFLLGEFIINVTKSFAIRPKDVHIIAHSLGAHIAGFSGKYIQYSTVVQL